MKKWLVIAFCVALAAGIGTYYMEKTDVIHKIDFTPWSDDFEKLPISEQDKQNIAALLTPLSSWSMMKLAFNQSEVEALGDRIRNIPFMRFLAYIFSDPQMKQMMTTIRGRSAIWRRFGSSLQRSLADNYANGQLTAYLEGFSEEVQIPKEELETFVQKQDWSGFLNRLFV